MHLFSRVGVGGSWGLGKYQTKFLQSNNKRKKHEDEKENEANKYFTKWLWQITPAFPHPVSPPKKYTPGAGFTKLS